MKIYFLNWSSSYEQIMVRYLVRNYGVKNISTPRKIHRLHKKFKYFGLTSSRIAKSYIAKQLKYINSDDIVITLDSNVFYEVNKDVIKLLKCKKVLLLRNPVSREFVQQVAPVFDKIYTFEESKSAMLGVDYLPQFIPIGYKDTKIYDNLKLGVRPPRCFFLGRDKGRLGLISELAKDLERAGCDIDFSIVKDRTSTEQSTYYIDEEVDYAQSLLKTIMSDVVIDIVQQGQTGLTLRVLEAAFLNKKMITNNVEIMDSELYSPERIFILGVRDWSEINLFLSSSPSPVNAELLYKYSPDSMLTTIKSALQRDELQKH